MGIGQKMNYVYILIKDKTPVYIGVTSNVSNRISKHKKTKDFDGYLIFYESESKQECLLIERSIIKFHSLYISEIGVLSNNSKYTNFLYKATFLNH